MSDPLAPTVAPTYIYKLISPASAYHPSDRVLPLSALDKADGFYHLSTSAQVPGTANRYFPGSKFSELLILKLRYDPLLPQIKWEYAPGPQDPERIFPHVYGDLLQEHIVGAITLDWSDKDQTWDFSQGWEDRVKQ